MADEDFGKLNDPAYTYLERVHSLLEAQERREREIYSGLDRLWGARCHRPELAEKPLDDARVQEAYLGAVEFHILQVVVDQRIYNEVLPQVPATLAMGDSLVVRREVSAFNEGR